MSSSRDLSTTSYVIWYLLEVLITLFYAQVKVLEVSLPIKFEVQTIKQEKAIIVYIPKNNS